MMKIKRRLRKMRDYPNRRPGFGRPEREDDFDKTLIRIILQMMAPHQKQDFIRRLTEDYAPDIQVKLYDFVYALICFWAGQTDLSREDARVIEDCRKICDLMGWASASW
jgi:hypothetical protein